MGYGKENANYTKLLSLIFGIRMSVCRKSNRKKCLFVNKPLFKETLTKIQLNSTKIYIIIQNSYQTNYLQVTNTI